MTGRTIHCSGKRRALYTAAGELQTWWRTPDALERAVCLYGASVVDPSPIKAGDHPETDGWPRRAAVKHRRSLDDLLGA